MRNISDFLDVKLLENSIGSKLVEQFLLIASKTIGIRTFSLCDTFGKFVEVSINQSKKEKCIISNAFSVECLYYTVSYSLISRFSC